MRIETMSQPDIPLLVFALLTIFASASTDPCDRYYHSVNGTGDRVDQCEFDYSNFHLTCSGGLDDDWETGSEDVVILTLCRWPGESLDPNYILTQFPALENLTVIDSNLTKLSNAFPNTAESLRIVRINGTGLNSLPGGAFSAVPNLTLLDLRHNCLTTLNHTEIDSPSLKEIYLSDNPWKSSIEMSWLLDVDNDSVASRVLDKDEMICRTDNRDRPLIPVLRIIIDLREECLLKTICRCELSYIGLRRRLNDDPSIAVHNKFMVFVTVNCSSMGLTEFPKILPNDTTVVDLSKNEIHDLFPLVNNSEYKRVDQVYLDYNRIESISVLEGSDWLDQFRVLSLAGNRLTDLPAYALENALAQNQRAVRILLGNNPWRCDCLFTPGFQNLLRRHLVLFIDHPNVTCAKIEDDENSGKQVIYLTRQAICSSPDAEYWIRPLDVLNGVLAFLIFFVIGKLLYDYWTFKRTGKLPWIVAKIP